MAADRNQLLWLFFSLKGRISPVVYLLAGLLLILVQIFTIYRFALADDQSTAQGGWAIVLILTALICLWSNIALVVKRLHDFGSPGIWAVVVILFGLFGFIVLVFITGDPGPNRYGTRTDAPD